MYSGANPAIVDTVAANRVPLSQMTPEIICQEWWSISGYAYLARKSGPHDY
jgi:hypothetical protein